MTITTSMAAAYAFLLAFSSQTDANGKRQKLPKVNLDDQVDLARAWEDVKETVRGVNRWRSSGFSSSGGGGNNSGKAAVESSNKEDQSKR